MSVTFLRHACSSLAVQFQSFHSEASSEPKSYHKYDPVMTINYYIACQGPVASFASFSVGGFLSLVLVIDELLSS